MVCFPIRSDRWWSSYLIVCTFVHLAGTFRLFAAECYKHATASSLIPLNPSRRAESDELSPNPGGPLAEELSVRREPISKSCEITQADNLNRRRRLSRKAQ